MKKSILVLVSLLIISYVAYDVLLLPTSRASNNPSESEYYYNNKMLGETDNTMDASESYQKEKHTYIAIDTEPSSITVLVNKEYGLPADYVPDDLRIPDITFSFSSYSEKKLMRAEAAQALEDLFHAAKDQGLSLYGVSGYRSYNRQLEIYEKNVIINGSKRTNMYSAKAGFSEHQSGLSMDVSTLSIHNRLDLTFSATPEGKWLRDHSYKYGFIIRYPEDKSEITGYAYEPWHIRYVGKDLARLLYDDQITLEEYYGYSPKDTLQEDITYGTAIDVDDSDYDINDNSPFPAEEEIEEKF